MIVIEGTLWPVIFLGVVDETTLAQSDAVVLTDDVLEMSEQLAIGVVVAGTGDQGVRSQQAALDWLESHEQLLRSRTLRLA